MSASARPGLSALRDLPLPPERAALLERLAAASQGPPEWRARKRVEARELLALDVLAPRVALLALDLATDLLAVVRLRVTVPCLVADGRIAVGQQVDLALRYPEEILQRPLRGAALVQILRPARVWHSNVSTAPGQRLCLGANVPRGFPLREAVLAAYAALTLQAITLDPADPAGIMNAEALGYWAARRERIPLSTEAFLDEPADHDRNGREVRP